MTKDQSILQAITLVAGPNDRLTGRLAIHRGADQEGEGAAPVYGGEPASFSRMRIWPSCFGKQPVVSTTTSWIFTATPYIVFASTWPAGLLVPVFASQTPLNFAGNIIALVYLLALGTFFLMSGGPRCRFRLRRDGKQP